MTQINVQRLEGELDLRASRYRDIRPRGAPRFDTLKQQAILACRRQPKLLTCTPASLLQAFMSAYQLGLDPSGTLGSAYVVPFNSKVNGKWITQAQLIPGYRGLIDLARRSGEILQISARVVREGDFFECEFGLFERLVHKPSRAPDRAAQAITDVYAVAVLRADNHPKGETRQFDVMSFEEVEAVRQNAPSKNSPAWQNHYAEMAKKTVVRRLMKYLPVSTDVGRALTYDDRIASDEPIDDVLPEVALLGEDDLEDVIEAPPEPEPQPAQAPAPEKKPAPARNGKGVQGLKDQLL